MTGWIDPTPQAAQDYFSTAPSGPVVMLNLLRFRAVADYSQRMDLAPKAPISGEAAFDIYLAHTLPFLTESGGELIFYGSAGAYLIGPPGVRWDRVMLVRQASAQTFLSFASNTEYLAGIDHRTAALEDSRLLPMVEGALVSS